MGRAERRKRTAKSIRKQIRIASQHNIAIKTPGYLRKRHCMDCGRPLCRLCGNPRRIKNSAENSKTIQELSHIEMHSCHESQEAVDDEPI